MKVILLAAILIVSGCAGTKKHDHQSITLPEEPKFAFTVTEGILHPESVLYSHAHRAIFVSNLATGNPLETKTVSYISKLSPDGKVIKAKWVTGLKAPKGLAIVHDHLFVSDLDRVVKIDIKQAKIVKTFEIKKAKFPNDVVADERGNIYVSDTFDNTIYILNKDGLKVWKTGLELNSPNGLFTDGEEHLITANWGADVDPKTFKAKIPGNIIAYPFTDKKVAAVEDITGYFDGITSDIKGNLWVSDWMSGDIYQISKTGKSRKRYNFGQGTADISIAKELGLLLVPQMNQSKIMAIYLE